MANYFVSYDLNGPNPTHEEMDAHLEKLGASRGRVLETVWYVGYSGTQSQLFDHVDNILSGNDSLLVISANNASFRNLLITDKSIQESWATNE